MRAAKGELERANRNGEWKDRITANGNGAVPRAVLFTCDRGRLPVQGTGPFPFALSIRRFYSLFPYGPSNRRLHSPFALRLTSPTRESHRHFRS